MMKVNSKEFKKWKIKDWQIRKLQVYIDYKNTNKNRLRFKGWNKGWRVSL